MQHFVIRDLTFHQTVFAHALAVSNYRFSFSTAGFGTAQFPFCSKEYTDENAVKYSEVSCPTAQALRAKTVCLFLHPSWEEEHIRACIAGMKEAIRRHLK